jgi:hypothetical protein
MFCTIPRSCHGRPQYRMIYVSYCKHWASTATWQPTRIGGAQSRNGWKATMCLPPTDCPRHRKSNARNRFWIDERPIDQMTAFISSGPSPRYGAMTELRTLLSLIGTVSTAAFRADPTFVTCSMSTNLNLTDLCPHRLRAAMLVPFQSSKFGATCNQITSMHVAPFC